MNAVDIRRMRRTGMEMVIEKEKIEREEDGCVCAKTRKPLREVISRTIGRISKVFKSLVV